jgi:uncharacterized RDD family membrane protein YckC
VELEDRITIATPEGVELQMVLAGAGSRFIAEVIDFTAQALVVALAALVTLVLIGGGVGEALFVIALFTTAPPLAPVYNVLFEVLGGGHTPGKRLTHLRVVRARGTPVDFPASAIRNLMRLIDWLPLAYLVGLVSILLTERNQRLGDIAAGTLVIRDGAAPHPPAARGPRARRRLRRRPSPPPASPLPPAPASPPAAIRADGGGWDVSAVSGEELVAVRRFLERRESLDKGARLELGHRLEQGLRAKVAGAPEGLGAEDFLQELARVKASR